MSSTNGINSNTVNDPSWGSSNTNKFGEITSDEFFNIMFTELSQQDPMDPQDSKALLDQIGTIRDIEANTNMMAQLEQMVTQNQFAAAAGLVGKHIAGLDELSSSVSGKVVAAGLEGDSIMLTLDNGSRVPFSNVEEIYDGSLTP